MGKGDRVELGRGRTVQGKEMSFILSAGTMIDGFRPVKTLARGESESLRGAWCRRQYQMGSDGTWAGFSRAQLKDPGFPLETDTPGSPQDRLDDSLCYVWRWGQVRDKRN